VAREGLSHEAIVHRYLHLVKYAAGRLSVQLPPHVEIGDLINDGVVGLLDAIEKYDGSRGVKFETYALTRIHGAMLDALRKLDWVPRELRRRARALQSARAWLEVELGRVPSNAELAAQLHVSLDELRRLQQRLRGAAIISLEERLPDAGSGGGGQPVTVAETLGDGGSDVGTQLERDEQRRELQRAVEELPDQQRVVIEAYYFRGQPLKVVKQTLGVSESRVSQIHGQAVAALRTRLHDQRGTVRGEVPGDALAAARPAKIANRSSIAGPEDFGP
jgi:RNA polymerase sigma factor for flagellar operon FliA